MGTSDGMSGFGTTLSGASVGTIANITNVEIPGMEVNNIDISTMGSPDGWKEFVAGMKDAGEITLGLLYEASQHDTIQSALGGAPEDWTITLPDTSTFVCPGYISRLGITIPMDDGITQDATIKLTGKPSFTAAS